MTSDLDLVIAGGGPAGMMAGLLFARAGCKCMVLEKHADFFRDFRGDTVHPSTLELLRELGLLDEFLKRPHDEMRTLTARVADRQITIADSQPFAGREPLHRADAAVGVPRFPRARRRGAIPAFTLRMEAEAVDLLFERRPGRRRAARGRRGGEGPADHRRRRPKLDPARQGRLAEEGPRRADRRAVVPAAEGGDAGNETGGTFGAGTFVVQLDRGDYWQCAYVVPKGAAEEIRAQRASTPSVTDVARGGARSRRPVDDAAGLGPGQAAVGLARPADPLVRPGLLAIGDAAHAMSPVGGVGINLAIQDAVAAANILAGPLAAARTSIPC